MSKWFIVLILLLPAVAWSKHAVRDDAVASAHPLATQAGMDILAAGGNAFDAAVVVSAALAVVEPYASGLGGGGFWLLHDARNRQDIVIDGREIAPHASTADMYLDAQGNPTDESVDGAKAAGIPGVPAALEFIADEYASRPLSDLLQPAIRLARRGFTVNEHYRQLAALRLLALRASPAAASIYLQDGRVPQTGFVLRQKDLADTLEQIARHGSAEFYTGKIAKKLVEGVIHGGGIWSTDDLSAYRIKKRVPIVTQYAGYEVVLVPPPSSGGVVITQALAMLEPYVLGKMNKIDRMHLQVEVMRRAYQTRALYLGDSDHVDIELKKLLSRDFARGLMSDFSVRHATPSSALPVSKRSGDGNHTTHFSIIDRHGNYVAATLSINYPFGSGFAPPGTGVLLNDEMDDFASAPDQPNVWGLVQSGANRIAPGKRMLSSMSPTFVRNDDRLLIVGTPGGSRIISMVLLALLDFIDQKPVEAIVAAHRFHHQYLPDEVQLETETLNQDQIGALKKKGHTVQVMSRRYGNMQAIHVDYLNAKTHAASDPRGYGAASVKSYTE